MKVRLTALLLAFAIATPAAAQDKAKAAHGKDAPKAEAHGKGEQADKKHDDHKPGEHADKKADDHKKDGHGEKKHDDHKKPPVR